jgi:hypothetical protein
MHYGLFPDSNEITQSNTGDQNLAVKIAEIFKSGNNEIIINLYFTKNPPMYLLFTEFSFYKLTHVQIKVEVTFLTIGLSNVYALIMPAMTILLLYLMPEPPKI